MIKKITFILSLNIILFPSFLVAQNTHKERGYTSTFYKKISKPVSKILFLYRPKLYTKKSFENFQNILLKQCDSNSVVINFAILGSLVADTLKATSDFICRIDISEIRKNYYYKIKVGEFRKNIFEGQGIKDFSILGFTNFDSGIPVWKCFCSLEYERSKKADEDTANCIYKRMIIDGIIR